MNNAYGRSGLAARLGRVPLLWLVLAAGGPLGACSKQPSSTVEVDPSAG